MKFITKMCFHNFRSVSIEVLRFFKIKIKEELIELIAKK